MSSSKAFALAALLAAPARASSPEGYQVRIGLLQGAESAQVRVDLKTRIRDLLSGESFHASPGTLVAAAAKGIIDLAGHHAKGKVELSHPSGSFVLNGTRYPGKLLLQADAQGLTAVNELELESYLEGVLPHEMSPSWPLEALKAQAVISRSFAVYNLGGFGGKGFDLAADVRSQVYKGLLDRSPLVQQAVRETKGEVLAYKGQLINTYFHACCGGHTRAASGAWSGGVAMRPLKGVSDGHCYGSPHFRWEAYFSNQAVLRALQQSGSNALKVTGLKVARREPSGHAATFLADTDKGRVEVSADRVRRFLNSTQFKSILVERIEATPKGFTFHGRGFGHGVGLCQWGAREQALKGRTYKSILRSYYPGVEFRHLEDPLKVAQETAR